MCKICEKYQNKEPPARGYFVVCPCGNMDQSTHVFQQHEKPAKCQRLEKKLYKSENELKEALQKAELSLTEKQKLTHCILLNVFRPFIA